MSTSILSASASDSLLSSSTAKTLKSIDVDDVKKEDVSSTYESLSKSVQVQVIEDGVHDGKEVEVEAEEQEVASTSEQLAEQDLESFVYQEEEVKDAESALFSSEMALALDHVRKLATFQKEALVNSICDTFASYNGREASINDISAIFGRIQNELALEAEEEAEEAEEEEIADEADSDYHPNDDPFDYELDQDINEAGLDYFSSDADDADYDPKDAEDVAQVEADLEEDGFVSEEEEVEEESEVISYDEEAIINSEQFDAEYFEAMECVVGLAKLEKVRILEKISKKYENEFGDEVIEKALEQFVDFEFTEEVDNKEAGDNEQDDEDVEEEEDVEEVGDSELEEETAVNSEEFRKEMDYALDAVRKLAASHKEAFVDEICGAFVSLTGVEPSLSELSSVLSAIKSEFAEEATQEFLEDIEEGDEEEVEGSDEEEIASE